MDVVTADQVISEVGQRLLETVTELRHLARNLPDPVRLCLLPIHVAGSIRNLPAVQRIVASAFARLEVYPVQFRNDIGSLSSIELFISRRMSQVVDTADDLFGTTAHCAQLDRLIAAFDCSILEVGFSLVEAPGAPGLQLATHAGVQREGPAVILVLPCGMPFDLCRPWFNALSQDFYVATWETRGLFGRCGQFDDVHVGVTDQVDDLVAVMDRLSIDRAHLMGVCGGAVIALAAAAEQPDRVLSLGLWYGDYNMSSNAVRTRHQQNFEWLMETASQSREEAINLYGMFKDQATLVTIPERIAHMALYPYTNPELLFRYAKINNALNKVDSLAYLTRVKVPTLVVTGDSDETTHSGGSKMVAQGIPGAVLKVEAGGSHQQFFNVSVISRDTAVRFIVSTSKDSEGEIFFA